MKKNLAIATLILITGITLFSSFKNETKETKFLQITSVESVVSMGAGRSRLIVVGADGAEEEMKLENLFSAGGINFQNIRMNDQSITDKITSLTNQGWELIEITPGVYSSDGGGGIFLTRYLFKKTN